MKRLHLIDGTYELFRAHFSKRPGHVGPNGQDLKATVGVASAMLALLHDESEAVTHLGIAFDNPIRSFRNDLFDGYKTEEGVPPELLAQFDSVEAACHAVGITVWSMKEFEADDAIATAAVRFRDEVDQVRIFTPDKDLHQVVSGNRIVQVDPVRQKFVDEEAVKKNKGVSPASIPDFLALVGDTADGIPGLDGWGEKGAGAVLSEYGKLENIPVDAASWKVKPRGYEKLCATFAAHREDALLYRTLATLRLDAPITKRLDDLKFGGVPKEKFLAWCDQVGVTTLKSRPTRWA